jgi:hypothetical protein
MLDKVMDPPKDVIDSSAEHTSIDLKRRVTDGVPVAREEERIRMQKDGVDIRDILDNYERYAKQDIAERERYKKGLIPYPKLRLSGYSMADIVEMMEEFRSEHRVRNNKTDKEFLHNDVAVVCKSWHSGSVSFTQIARLAGDICILISKYKSIPWCEGSDMMCLAVWLYDNHTMFWTPGDEVDMWVQLQHIYDAFMQHDVQKHIQERYERLDDPRRTLPNVTFLTGDMWETAELKKVADAEMYKKERVQIDAHNTQLRLSVLANRKEHERLGKNWSDAYYMTRKTVGKYGWSHRVEEYRKIESQALAAWRSFSGRPHAIPRPNDWTMPVVDDRYDPGDYRLYFRSAEDKAQNDRDRYKAYLVWDKLLSRDSSNIPEEELKTWVAEDAAALKTWDLMKDGTERANEIRGIPAICTPKRW